MRSFPTVHDLAAATEDEVNAHWAGLGFYRRARLLHQGAKFIVEEYNGTLPTTPQELSKIQGIGPYTAAAIASIAFDVCVPVVDGNHRQYFTQETGIAKKHREGIVWFSYEQAEIKLNSIKGASTIRLDNPPTILIAFVRTIALDKSL